MTNLIEALMTELGECPCDPYELCERCKEIQEALNQLYVDE